MTTAIDSRGPWAPLARATGRPKLVAFIRGRTSASCEPPRHATEYHMSNTAARASINVTPLIDVLRVLLIIFMVAAPMRPAKLDVKIPQKPTSATDVPSEESLVVTIAQDGRL